MKFSKNWNKIRHCMMTYMHIRAVSFHHGCQQTSSRLYIMGMVRNRSKHMWIRHTQRHILRPNKKQLLKQGSKHNQIRFLLLTPEYKMLTKTSLARAKFIVLKSTKMKLLLTNLIRNQDSKLKF